MPGGAQGHSYITGGSLLCSWGYAMGLREGYDGLWEGYDGLWEGYDGVTNLYKPLSGGGYESVRMYSFYHY